MKNTGKKARIGLVTVAMVIALLTAILLQLIVLTRLVKGFETASAAALGFSILALILFIPLLMETQSFWRRFELIKRALLGRGDEEADIGALISATQETSLVADIGGMWDFLLRMNDDLSLLQRSGVKFDLFASDILFSARNLARQAESELEMLVALREKSEGYRLRLLSTKDELASLTTSIGGYVAGAEALKQRALSSRDLLHEVSRATSEATEGARGGAASLAATGASAQDLLKSIRDLDAVNEKEAAEAKRISTALRDIEDIVERTHILATNASIEAAHAGTRGAGFGVIAQEIRKLAASSRASLLEIAAILGSIAKGIEASAALSSASSESARRLGGAVAESETRFSAIVERVGGVDRILGEFARVFADQIAAASSLAGSASEAASQIGRFGRVFDEGATDYRSIAEAAGTAELGAMDARRSSKVLAQLSGYLKVGGLERNRVLHKYHVLDSTESQRFARREARRLLLYNLEVADEGGEPLGYLGDLSPSGMMILSEKDLEVGARLWVRIILPLSSDGERSVSVRIHVRRVERDNDGIRAGCAFLDVDAAVTRDLRELLSTLALDAIATPPATIPSGPQGDRIEEAGELEDL